MPGRGAPLTSVMEKYDDCVEPAEEEADDDEEDAEEEMRSVERHSAEQ